MKNRLSYWWNLLGTSTPREPEEVAQAVDVPDVEPLFEFTAWPKTARLLRDIVITEKIDGTNAAILIKKVTAGELMDWIATGDRDAYPHVTSLYVDPADASRSGFDRDVEMWVIGAQSRNRLISWQKDNQGFAHWIAGHGRTLVEDLGEGRHFGEFWGNKIGRGYGLPEGDKRFSLFNPETFGRPGDQAPVIKTPGLDVVPVLYEGPLDTTEIKQTLLALATEGSRAVPGYPKPEGIIVYHTHARRILGKVTLDNQDAGKWEPQA